MYNYIWYIFVVIYNMIIIYITYINLLKLYTICITCLFKSWDEMHKMFVILN